MSTVIRLLQACVMIAVVFCLFEIGLTARSLRTTVSKFDGVAAGVNKTLDDINRPCSKDISCGTLADINRTLATLRGTSGQIELAAIHENKQLSTLDAQEKTLYSDLHTTLVAGQKTLNNSSDLLTTTNTTVAGLQPVIAEAHTSLIAVTASVNSLDVIIKDPSIPATLKSLQTTSEQTAATMSNVTATTEDVKQAVHSYTHPTWAHKIFSWSLAVAHALNPL